MNKAGLINRAKLYKVCPNWTTYRDLIDAVIEYVINDTLNVAVDEERYIPIAEFYRKHPFCHLASLPKMFKRDQNFFKTCGKKKGGRYFIQEKAALSYLKAQGSDKIRKKIFAQESIVS